MASISDVIEAYLKSVIVKSKTGYIEIRRNELAGQFNCVPSQINYVLSTRFTVNHGFVVESRRGGAGYVRIEKIFLKNDANWQEKLHQMLKKELISHQIAIGILQRLLNEEQLTTREYKIMKNMLEKVVLKVEAASSNKLRADILKAMMIALLTENGDQQE
ncbi:MAG: CtsR family transcriptional regulator [Desulfotomaculum sp.]|nr:CtsR family transcriptional regulator [Desulfotomaculum sp.]